MYTLTKPHRSSQIRVKQGTRIWYLDNKEDDFKDILKDLSTEKVEAYRVGPFL